MRIKDLAMYSVVSMTLLLTTIGCDINSPAKRELQHEADSLINAAYEAKNYEQILTLADSLNKTGLSAKVRLIIGWAMPTTAYIRSDWPNSTGPRVWPQWMTQRRQMNWKSMLPSPAD